MHNDAKSAMATSVEICQYQRGMRLNVTPRSGVVDCKAVVCEMVHFLRHVSLQTPSVRRRLKFSVSNFKGRGRVLSREPLILGHVTTG